MQTAIHYLHQTAQYDDVLAGGGSHGLPVAFEAVALLPFVFCDIRALKPIAFRRAVPRTVDFEPKPGKGICHCF